MFEGPSDTPTRTTRLSKQHEIVKAIMSDGEWRTLKEIEAIALQRHGVICPHASVSAQLRHLRKPRFGSHLVEKKHVGNGLYLYHVGRAGSYVTEPAVPVAPPVCLRSRREIEALIQAAEEYVDTRAHNGEGCPDGVTTACLLKWVLGEDTLTCDNSHLMRRAKVILNQEQACTPTSS